jgi:hypothetical protein
MEDIYLQEVIVTKTIPLGYARFKAQKYIKNRHKTFVREFDDGFHFRNLPKSSFRDLTLKKINDEITLVVGHLDDKESRPSDLEAK